MTRIRKGHNLLRKGHLQPNFVLAPCPLNQETPVSSRVVDNKAIFNSILDRISSMSSDGEAVETSKDKHGVVPGTLGDDDTQGESAVTTAGVCSAAGQRLDSSKSGSAAQQERTHVDCATKKPKSEGELVRTKNGRGAFSGRVANESASSRSHPAIMDLISRGYELKDSDTSPGKLSGLKRVSMEDSGDPGTIVYEGRNVPSSGLEAGDEFAKVPDFKRRNIGQAEDHCVHQLTTDDRNIHVSPWSEEGTLRWSSESGLSTHLKRPRTQTRRSGGTAGRMARKRPRPPDSSAPENEDTRLERGNEAKGPCLHSPPEQMTGPKPSDTAGTRVSQRTEAESSVCRTKDEGELMVQMSSVQKMEEAHAVQEPDMDDPSKQPPGSLMHSLHLVFLEAGSCGLSVREAMTSMAKKGLLAAAVAREREVSIVQVRGELASSPYFIEVEEGRFYLCSSLQDMPEVLPPEVLAPKPTNDEPCPMQMGTFSEQRMEAERTGIPRSEAGSGQDKEDATLATLGSSGEPAGYTLQGREESSMRGTALVMRDSLSSDRSYDSDKADRESDEDFDVRDHFSDYSSESTTISDSQLSGEEDMTSHQRARSTRSRGASAGQSDAAKNTGWRYWVDSVSEEDNDSKLGRQCGRTDGRRWQCPLRAGVGYSLCEHHQEKFRRKKAYAVLQRRAVAERRASNKSREPTPEPRSSSASLRRDTAEPDGQGKEQIAFSTHLNSKGQRKTVKNRSLMSMY